jgi:hypothetical protein
MKYDTIDKLITLKQEGYTEIYYVNLRGQDFLFRPLTFRESDIIEELEQIPHISPVMVNETILRMCVLNLVTDIWLTNDSCLAGVPDVLAQMILDCSGFSSSEAVGIKMKEKRESAETLHNVISNCICSVFHSYTPSDIQNMTLDEQLSILAKAELILGTSIDIRS